jgi:hypothetical protein
MLLGGLLDLEVGSSNRDRVAAIEDLAVEDMGVVDFGAVLAAEVFNPKLTVLESNECVLFRDVYVIYADVIARIAPNSNASRIYIKAAPVIKRNQGQRLVCRRRAELTIGDNRTKIKGVSGSAIKALTVFQQLPVATRTQC